MASNPANSQSESEDHLFHTQAVKHNLSSLGFIRSSWALLGGAAVGILGLKSFQGFIFYFIISLFGFGFLSLKASLKPSVYFPSVQVLVFHEVFANLSSYVLFWTLFYGLVHIYE